MVTVYVVMDGMYEDYGIQGIFSSPEKAQGFIDSPYGESLVSAEIKEWKLDDPELAVSHWVIEMLASGLVVNSYLSPGRGKGFVRWSDTLHRGWQKSLVWETPQFISAHISRKQAILLTNEIREKILELNMWGDPFGLVEEPSE